jgi:hypothetical protein
MSTEINVEKKKVGRPRMVRPIENIIERDNRGRFRQKDSDDHHKGVLAQKRATYLANKLAILANPPEDTMRVCGECKVSKSKTNEFYRAGKYFSRSCRDCYNKLRITTSYNPKEFCKMALDLKSKIIYDYSAGDDIKDIYNKYKIEYPAMNLDNLIKWESEGKIPKLKTKIFSEKLNT